MQYKTLKSVTLDGEIRQAGSLVIINDQAMAEKLLTRGTIVLANDKDIELDVQTIQEEVVVDTNPPLDQSIQTPDAQELQKTFEETGAVLPPSESATHIVLS